MSDVAVQPTANQQPYEVGQPLSDEAKKEADAFFADLKKQADAQADAYMAARVPAYLQEYFREKYPAPSA